MAIQRLALTALTTLLTSPVLAAPAMAAPTFSQWINAIDSAGIQRKVDRHCHPGILATYRWRQHAIYLCDGAFSGDQQDLLDTIAHEAVHAAQHCMARKRGMPGLLPFSIAMREWNQGKAFAVEAGIRGDLINRGETRAEGDLIEIEAYSMERRPDLALELLVGACNR